MEEAAIYVEGELLGAAVTKGSMPCTRWGYMSRSILEEARLPKAQQTSLTGEEMRKEGL